jgi:hypothetical protein
MAGGDAADAKNAHPAASDAAAHGGVFRGRRMMK